MKFLTYPAGVYRANCYIVYDESTGDGFVIDPGGDPQHIMDMAVKNSIRLGFIILTHGHFDHTGGVNVIKDKLNISVYMNEKDAYLVSGDKRRIGMLPLSDKILIGKYICDGDVIKYGDETITVIETPGHTPGSISISAGSILFTGDTLFEGSIGRTDFPGGSLEQLRSSVKEKLFVFPDTTAVYPGHEGPTTIGHEKQYNPFL